MSSWKSVNVSLCEMSRKLCLIVARQRHVVVGHVMPPHAVMATQFDNACERCNAFVAGDFT